MTAPMKSEAETTIAASLGSRDQKQSDSSHGSDRRGTGQAPLGYTKRLANVTAQLAVKGFSLYPLTDETLLVTRWNMSRVLPSIEAAERFYRMVGGDQ